MKELDYINIDIRSLLKNDFIYEVEFEKTNTYLQEKVIELINKIIYLMDLMRLKFIVSKTII